MNTTAKNLSIQKFDYYTSRGSTHLYSARCSPSLPLYVYSVHKYIQLWCNYYRRRQYTRICEHKYGLITRKGSTIPLKPNILLAICIQSVFSSFDEIRCNLWLLLFFGSNTNSKVLYSFSIHARHTRIHMTTPNGVAVCWYCVIQPFFSVVVVVDAGIVVAAVIKRLE